MGKGFRNNTNIAVISVKLKIVPVSNHWLIYQKNGKESTAIGRIRRTPNSFVFLLSDKKARLEARKMEDKIIFKISSDGTVLRSTYLKDKNSLFLNWKTNHKVPKILKCYAKYSRNYLSFNDTKLATTLPISDNSHIIKLQTSTDFSPIVLLASLFPFIGN
jgi:hypothetical protein